MFNLIKRKKMKKILMTIAAAFVAVTMNAQVFVGGSVGVASIKNGNADAETTYKFVPEIGYNINDEFAVGVTVGYQQGACSLLNGTYAQDVTTKAFTISPYARYTVVSSNLVNVFVDGGVGFGSYKDLGTEFSIGLKPGVALKLNDNLSFVTHFGFVGYSTFNPDTDGIDNSNAVGVDFDQNNLTFGLYWNF